MRRREIKIGYCLNNSPKSFLVIIMLNLLKKFKNNLTTGELSFPKNLPYKDAEFIIIGSLFKTYKAKRINDNKEVIIKLPYKKTNIILTTPKAAR